MATFEENNCIVLDCFAGADGGYSYAKYLIGMRGIAKRAENGDKDAKEILLIIERFARLVKIMSE